MQDRLFNLRGKCALVTGASGGLVAHFARVLAAHGAEVVLAARRLDALEAVAGMVSPNGAVQCVQLDVTDAASRAALARVIEARRNPGQQCWAGTRERCARAHRRRLGCGDGHQSRAGVVQLTKALALEWARHGIRVNALAPGYINTELNRDFWQTDRGKALITRIPQHRLGRPKDLDGPLLLLAPDSSRYMTGAVIAVDGGHLVNSL